MLLAREKKRLHIVQIKFLLSAAKLSKNANISSCKEDVYDLIS